MKSKKLITTVIIILIIIMISVFFVALDEQDKYPSKTNNITISFHLNKKTNGFDNVKNTPKPF